MDTDTPSNGYGPKGGAALSEPSAPAPDAIGTTTRHAGTALFRERFEQLLPAMQKQWPQVAEDTLEAPRGSPEPDPCTQAAAAPTTSDGNAAR